jgi:hypothetical protein
MLTFVCNTLCASNKLKQHFQLHGPFPDLPLHPHSTFTTFYQAVLCHGGSDDEVRGEHLYPNEQRFPACPSEDSLPPSACLHPILWHSSCPTMCLCVTSHTNHNKFPQISGPWPSMRSMVPSCSWPIDPPSWQEIWWGMTHFMAERHGFWKKSCSS